MADRTSRFNRVACLVIVFTLLGLLPAIPAKALDDNIQAILLYDRSNYKYYMGEPITFELHTYMNTQRRDCDNLTMVQLNATGWIWSDNFTATNLSTGAYRIDMILPDPGDDRYTVRLTFYCKIDGRSATDEFYRSVYKQRPELGVEVTVNKPLADMGDKLDFTVRFTDGEDPVDPSEAEVSWYRTIYNIEETDLSFLTKKSKGVYTHSLTLNDTHDPGKYGFKIEASLDEKTGSGEGYAWFSNHDVWLKMEKFDMSAIQGAFYISNKTTGKQVRNASVFMSCEYWDSNNDLKKLYINNESDATGKVPFNYTLEGYNHGLFRMYSGSATDRDSGQGSPFYIYPEYRGDKTRPKTPQEEVNPDSAAQFIRPYKPGLNSIMLKPGNTLDLNYRLLTYGNASNASLGYYYISQRSYHPEAGIDPIIEVGNLSIDPTTGNFTLSVTMPEKVIDGIRVDFALRSDKHMYWIEPLEEIMAPSSSVMDTSISLEAKNFGIGNLTRFTVQKDGFEGSAYFHVAPIGNLAEVNLTHPYELGWYRSHMLTDPEWTHVMVEGTHSESFFLPDFLPSDENYMVMAVLENEIGSIMNYIVVDAQGNLLSGDPGDPIDDPTNGTDDEEDDDGGFLPGPGLIVAALAATIVAVTRRRS